MIAMQMRYSQNLYRISSGGWVRTVRSQKGVIVTIPFAAHAHDNAILRKQLAVVGSRILTAVIRMVQ